MSDHVRPPIPLSSSPLNLQDGTAVRHCKGLVHVFAEIPGSCQCGTGAISAQCPRTTPGTCPGRSATMAKCANCGSLKLTEQRCPKCGKWTNAKERNDGE